MLIFLFYSLLVSVSGYVFTRYLIHDGDVLQVYGGLIKKIPYDFISKPLGLCTKCFTGQLALWYGIYVSIPMPLLLGFVCLSILLASILEDRV